MYYILVFEVSCAISVDPSTSWRLFNRYLCNITDLMQWPQLSVYPTPYAGLSKLFSLSFVFIEILIIYLGTLAVHVVRFVQGYFFSNAGSVLLGGRLLQWYRYQNPCLSLVVSRRNLPERDSWFFRTPTSLYTNLSLDKESWISVFSAEMMQHNNKRAVCVIHWSILAFMEWLWILCRGKYSHSNFVSIETDESHLNSHRYYYYHCYYFTHLSVICS